MNAGPPHGCLRSCLAFGLSATVFLFVIICSAIWLAGAALPAPMLAAFAFLACVGAGVSIVCVMCCAIERLTAFLFS